MEPDRQDAGTTSAEVGTKKRVVVIGSGPAGLASAARLLERAGNRVSVRLVHMGHNLGGKAASYTNLDGQFLEHGWHMVVGFYERMKGLMRRAGIDPARALVSMGGNQHCYESFDGKIHHLKSRGGRGGAAAGFAGYDGLPLEDRLPYGRFFAEAYALVLSGADLSRWDDLCFSRWAVDRGLRPHCVKYSLFRFLREAYFNFPEEISAYHVLQTMRHMASSEDAELLVATGGFSEIIWNPIGRYVERLGAKVIPYTLVTDFVYDGRRLTGLRVARPDPAGHDHGASSWRTHQIPIEPGSESTLSDFDYVISTIPCAVLTAMNASDDRMWSSPYFSRIRNLRSAATLSMTVRTKRPVGALPGPVFGLASPLGISVDMKPYWTQARSDPAVGSVLAFSGQESGFETWSDAQLVSRTLDVFSASPQFGDVRKAEILDIELHRNRSAHERIFLCEPGVQQFRPGPRTPFRNLWVAGDWVRNEVDLVCMEGAIASGQQAADDLLEQMGSA